MDTVSKYDRAAPTWGSKVSRLGYLTAYDGFLANRTVPDGCVLDVGTGDGMFARSWVAQSGSPDLTLLDPSASMLVAARAQFTHSEILPRFEIAGLEEFQTDLKFNAILAAHVLEHFTNPHEAFCKLAGLLAPGGQLFLVVSKPHWCNWLIWLRFRHKWYDAAIVCEMANCAGLEHCLTYAFKSGPPSRTSLGYLFTQQKGR